MSDVEVLSSFPCDEVPEERGAIPAGSTIAPDIPPQGGWAWGVPEAVPFKPTWGGLKGYADRLDDMRMDKELEDTQVWSDKVDRVRRTRSGVSPPPRGVVSESTDSRRIGENAGRYISSSGPEDKEESPDLEET